MIGLATIAQHTLNIASISLFDFRRLRYLFDFSFCSSSTIDLEIHQPPPASVVLQPYNTLLEHKRYWSEGIRRRKKLG
jgi:hypothetical protein